MNQTPRRRIARRPLSRADLLPLPIGKVRALSLEHHLALVAARCGHGNLDQISNLARIVYLTWFMRDMTPDAAAPEPFRQIDAAFERCFNQVQAGEPWTLLEDELELLERIVVLHDQQLATIAAYRYHAAWARLERWVARHDRRSPVTASEPR